MIHMSHEQAKDKGRRLVHDILKDMEHRRDADFRRQVVRNMYYGNSERLDIHWEGASDIHLPVVADKVDGTVPKWKSALMDMTPIVMLRRPADDPYPDAVREQEQFINWALTNDIPDFDNTVEDWIRNACLDPVSYVKTSWVREFRTTTEVHRLKADWQPGEVTFANFQVPEGGDPLPKEPVDLMIELFGPPVEQRGQNGLLDFYEDEEEEGSFKADIIEDRRPYYNVQVQFVPGEFVDEVEAHVTRTILHKDHPVVEVVEFEDLIVPFRASSIQSAQRVTQQYWLTPSQIDRLRSSEGWDISDDEMSRIYAGRHDVQEEIPENDSAKRVLDMALGETGKEEGVQGVDAYNEGLVLIFEVYVTDEDATGQPVEMIYQIPYCLKRIVHEEALDTVFPHGRRPFAEARWVTVSGRYMGISQGEFLAAIQVQVNTTINQVNDAQTLINNPWFFYTPTAMPKGGQELRNLFPGQGVPVNDVTGVLFPQWSQQPLANLGVGLDPVLLFADRLTISPMQSGNTQVRNAPRTARGTLALLSEGNQKLDNVVHRHQKSGWHEVVYQLLALYQYYMPDEKWFWVMGNTDNRARVTHKQMRGRWEILFQGNTINTNREVQRVLALQRYQLGMANPLYANDPMALRELLRDVLRSHSEGTDVDRLMPKLPGEGAYQHPPMTQKAENQALKMGIGLDVLPTDDHATHMAEIDRYVATPEFETLPQHVVALFAQHKRQHMQMLQSQISAQTQFGLAGASPSSGGAEQSLGPDVGLGNLEGGIA